MKIINSIIHNFLKKCETPPTESAFWILMNLLMNYVLIIVGRFLLNNFQMKENREKNYVLVSSKNMGDLLALYRSLNELKYRNGFANITLISDAMFETPLKALKVNDYHIVPFWKIIAMGKELQACPDRYPNIVQSAPWLLYGIENKNPHGVVPPLPCSVSEKSLKAIFPFDDMKGNTVILSPYEQTVTNYGLKLLPMEFWVMLANRLQKHGFYVFTNCNGKTEQVIEGTTRFFPRMGELAGSVQYAGYCVSMRSGFSDWISSAHLKKEMVLYPTRRFYEYYNLKMLWGKTDVFEYIYGESELSVTDLVDMIVQYIIEGE